MKNTWSMIIVCCMVGFTSLLLLKQPAVVADIDLHSPDADYYFILAYDAYISHHWDEAVKYYKKALQYDPNSPYLNVQIGIILSRTGDVQGALAMAEEVLRSHPAYVPALMIAAEIYANQKRYQDAISLYNKVLKGDHYMLDNFPPIARNLVKILSARVRLSDQMIQSLATLDVNGRVARQLLAFAERYNQKVEGGIKIRIALTQGGHR